MGEQEVAFVKQETPTQGDLLDFSFDPVNADLVPSTSINPALTYTQAPNTSDFNQSNSLHQPESTNVSHFMPTQPIPSNSYANEYLSLSRSDPFVPQPVSHNNYSHMPDVHSDMSQSPQPVPYASISNEIMNSYQVDNLAIGAQLSRTESSVSSASENQELWEVNNALKKLVNFDDFFHAASPPVTNYCGASLSEMKVQSTLKSEAVMPSRAIVQSTANGGYNNYQCYSQTY